MNTTIISSGAIPCTPPVGALCAIASGIKPFMTEPNLEGGALCHSPLGDPPAVQVAGGEACERSGCDGGAQRTHQLQVKMQVVKRVQARAQYFVAAIEVPQVRTRVVAAGVAGALGIEWTEIRGVRAVANVDDAR